MRIFFKLPSINLVNIWIYAVLLSIIARLVFWIFTIFYPIPNETGLLISPLLANSGIDLNFYINESIRFKTYIINLINFNFPITQNSLEHIESLKKIHEFTVGDYVPTEIQFSPGIFFPILLLLTNFVNIPWILSFCYLIFSSYLIYISIKWLNNKKVSWYWLFLYGLLPVPFWYMINISPDLLFSLIVTIFIINISSDKKESNNKLFYLFFLSIVSIMLKPNGVSLLIFVFYFFIFRNFLNINYKLPIILISILIFLIFIYFYNEYLISYIVSSNSGRLIFGYYQIDYLNGIYSFIPNYLNKFFSIISLLIAKFIYFSGIRPTFGDTLDFLVLIRSLAGIIILPGIFWLFLKANNNIRIFTIIFLFPIMLGLAQERYSLPIYPLLFYYGTIFYTFIFKNIYNVFRRF